jgi:cytochrome P450
VHYLSRHPDIQEGLREEIMAVEEDDLAKLRGGDSYPLLEAVVKETLRVQPPVNAMHRVVSNLAFSRLSI